LSASVEPFEVKTISESKIVDYINEQEWFQKNVKWVWRRIY
jgi:hypothetical protein